jgi:4-amino-4-deoxy-L-arabinose transferase-like glycosyltransferase
MHALPERATESTFWQKVNAHGIQIIQTHPFTSLFGLGLLVWGVLYGVGLGHAPLLDVDEPRYAQASLEMLQRGDWIVPWFNDKVRFDKPILFYWLQMVCYLVSGVSAFAARLPSILMLGLSVLGTAWVTYRQLGLRTACYTTLVHLSMLFMLVLGSMSMTDMTLATWMWLTVLGLWQSFPETKASSQGTHDAPWLVWGLTILCAVLGVMTKGPVALALPGLWALLWPVLLGGFSSKVSLPQTSHWQRLTTTLYPWGLRLLTFGAVVLLLSSPWFLLAAWKTGPIFWEKLFFHNIVRFKSVVSSHASPWWFYVPVTVIGLFPWTHVAMAGVQTFYQAFRTKQPTAETPKTLPTNNLAFVAMALGWFGLVFLFFTMAKTKLLTYLLPGMGAWSVVLGWTLAQWYHHESIVPRWLLTYETKVLSWLLGTVLLLMGGSALWMTRNPAHLPNALHALLLEPLVYPIPLATILVGFVGIFTVGWLLLQRGLHTYRFTTRMIASTVGLMVSISLLYRFVLLPHLVEVNQGDFRPILTYMRPYPKDALVTIDMLKPALLFYHQHPVKEFQTETLPELQKYAVEKQDIWVVIKLRHPHLLERLKAMPILKTHVVYRGRKFMLVHCHAGK